MCENKTYGRILLNYLSHQVWHPFKSPKTKIKQSDVDQTNNIDQSVVQKQFINNNLKLT